MKYKINKACDLNSISVFPPQSRRLSNMAAGGSLSQLRSQQSQLSFSSSQLSQNSLDENLLNDPRFGSQERENPVKRTSYLPPMSFPREDSQIQISRSSANAMRKWSSSSASDDSSGQISDQLLQRIGVIENSVSRIGVILDSVQSDVMQANKGTKEISMELDSIRQKLNVCDNTLQLVNKVQEDTKVSLEGSLKSVYEQLSKYACQDKLHEILSVVAALPDRMEACFLKLQTDLIKTLTKEMETSNCNLKANNQICETVAAPALLLPAEDPSCNYTPQERQQALKSQSVLPNLDVQSAPVPQVEMGRWNFVRREKTFGSKMVQRQNQVSYIEQEREWRVIIDSDDENDAGFPCSRKEIEKDIVDDRWSSEAKEETRRILRKARRRKRKCSNTIIIN